MTLVERNPRPFHSDAWDMPMRPLQEHFKHGTDLPAVNIKDAGDHFLLEVAVPGYRKQDLKVQVDHGVLHISSERREEAREDSDRYARREFHYSAFERLFRLPEEADDEQVKATCTDGVLRLTIGKRAVAHDRPGRQVKVE